MKLSFSSILKIFLLCSFFTLALEANLLSSAVSFQSDCTLEKNVSASVETVKSSNSTATKSQSSRSFFYIASENSQKLDSTNKAVLFDTITEVADPKCNIFYDPQSQIFNFGQSGYYSVSFVAVIGEKSNGSISFILNGQILSGASCPISSTSANSIINTIVNVPSSNSNNLFQVACTDGICNLKAASVQVVFISN